MQNIPAIHPEQATGVAQDLYAAIKGQLGGVPNIFRTMANAPNVLEGYLGFNGALGKGTLSAREREQIALACAGANACDYCASAHTALGKMAGLNEAETQKNLHGQASDAKAQALVAFVRKTVRDRATSSAAELGALRAAGYNDGQIVEIVANISANIFTNYFNHIAGTDIDFPVVESAAARAA